MLVLSLPSVSSFDFSQWEVPKIGMSNLTAYTMSFD
jgi:hypothetical protein